MNAQRQGGGDAGGVCPSSVEAAHTLLDQLPYPVLWIAADYEVRWRNVSARKAYGADPGRCHEVTHGYPESCDRYGEVCPKRRTDLTHKPASVGHVHRTREAYSFFKVTALPVDGGGVLEFHVPLDDSFVRDPLTRAYARHFFEQLVRQQLALLERIAVPYSVAMADLDHFKEINDQHGHQAGDGALRAVGQAILATIRSADSVGRFGGDEFCLFLPGARKGSAVTLARRIQQELHRIPVPHGRQPLTASFGIYSSRTSYDLQAAVVEADRALYQAKGAGRDTIVVA